MTMYHWMRCWIWGFGRRVNSNIIIYRLFKNKTIN